MTVREVPGRSVRERLRPGSCHDVEPQALENDESPPRSRLSAAACKCRAAPVDPAFAGINRLARMTTKQAVTPGQSLLALLAWRSGAR